MVTCSSISAWKIPQTEESGRLRFMGSQSRTQPSMHMDHSPGSPVHGDFPGKNTGVGCHFLLQGISMTHGSNPQLLHCQADSLPLSHQESQALSIHSL